MPRVEETTVGPRDADRDETTSPAGLPRVSLDRHHIKSLRAAVDRIAPTGLWNGHIEEEAGTLTGSGTQLTPDPPNCAFSILPPSVSPIPTPTLHPTQEWEGWVTEIHDDEFEARLLNVTAGDEVDREVATIPLEEVGAEDRTLMRVGSIFRWVIGYERSVGGTRRSVSQIVFLDPPRLTERDLEKGREWAEWLLEEWGVE